MKRLVVLVALPLAGCLNFDALLDAGCSADASWAECRVTRDDAGPEDAGVDAGDGPLDGGFCSSSGWCWENPALPGAVDLFAVWGTSDTDVWAAGSGGAVLRFNGTRWWKVDVSLAPDASFNTPEAVVRAVSIDDAGVAWVVGEDMAIIGFSRDGVRRLGASRSRIAAATWGGATWFLTPDDVERLRLGETAMTTVPLAGNNLLALTANEGGAFVAYDQVAPDNAAVRSVTSMVATPLSTPAMTRVEYPRNFARRGGHEVLLCANGDAFESGAGGAWDWVGQAVPSATLRHHAIDALADGGARWWFAGDDGVLASTEGALDAGVVLYTTGGGMLRSSWVSPSGHHWAVGSAGVVYETTPDGAAVARGAPLDYDLLDVAVNGAQVVAVGRGGVTLTRTSTGDWARAQDPAAVDLRAVALGPLGVCTLDLFGVVLCSAVGSWDSGAMQADGGIFPVGQRGSGAIAQRSDGGAVMGLGTTVATYTSGAWSVLDAGLTRDNLSDLALTPTGFAIAVNAGEPDALSNGAVVIFAGGARTAVCDPPGAAPIFGLARVAQGVMVVGPGVVGECSADGQFTAVSVPLQRAWVSGWVDAEGGWWLLDDSGFVLRRPAEGSWQRERLPLGGSGLDGPATTRIVGDDDELYVVGKSGTVLRRRFP